MIIKNSLLIKDIINIHNIRMLIKHYEKGGTFLISTICKTVIQMENHLKIWL